MIRVTVWNENYHEKTIPEMKDVYPKGLHGTIAEFLSGEEDFEVRVATQDQPEFGLSDEVLNNTDVLVWWGHAKQNDIPDELSRKVALRVQSGIPRITILPYSNRPSTVKAVWRQICLQATATILPQSRFGRGFSTIMIMITAFYLIVGMIRIHDYSFGEFIITSILTVIGMVLIIFFVFLVGVLVQQLWGFIVTLVSEAIQVIGGKA